MRFLLVGRGPRPRPNSKNHRKAQTNKSKKRSYPARPSPSPGSSNSSKYGSFSKYSLSAMAQAIPRTESTSFPVGPFFVRKPCMPRSNELFKRCPDAELNEVQANIISVCALLCCSVSSTVVSVSRSQGPSRTAKKKGLSGLEFAARAPQVTIRLNKHVSFYVSTMVT